MQDLTIEQMNRTWKRLMARMGDGGMFGWDWPTLAIVAPGIYSDLQRIKREVQRREIAAQRVRLGIPGWARSAK